MGSANDQSENLIGDFKRTLKTFVAGLTSQTLIHSSHKADEVLQAIAAFLKESETKYEISEKTYKVTVTEKIASIEDERELKY